jgi:glycosyltransferase involved in cell wall biosynthesis
VQQGTPLVGANEPPLDKELDVKVSIIIPAYNTAEYLRQCLDSAINQTLKEIEIIIIDDASTDDTLEIIREYGQRDGRIRVIAFEENRGNGFGRNEAMRQATGTYLMFLDSDDWLDENAVEIIYRKAMTQVFDVVMYGHLSHHTDSRKNITFQLVCQPTLADNDPDFFKYWMQQRKGLSCMPWQYLVAKKLVMSNEILFSEGIYFEDVIFTIMVAYYAKSVAVLKLPLYNYRRREGSITTSASKKKIADMFTSLGIVKEFLEAEGIFKQYQREYLIRFLTHGICYNFLDYFTLSKKNRDMELDNYMNRLRKSKLLRRENVLLLKQVISELGEDESRTKSSYLLCYKIMYSLVSSYRVFWFSYKMSFEVRKSFHRLFTAVDKIKLSTMEQVH